MAKKRTSGRAKPAAGPSKSRGGGESRPARLGQAGTAREAPRSPAGRIASPDQVDGAGIASSPRDPPFAVPDWPATTPKLLPLREIIPYERNPRTHPPEQIALLAKLMLRHGVDQPIVVDEANVVLKGHGRLLAAQQAGFETFPVVTHRGLSATEKTALRIEDNQLALLSGWDRGLLRVEMVGLKAAGYDMPLLGFGEAQLVQFMAGAQPPDEFAAFGEDIETKHQCPKCGYRWSGGKPG